MKPKQNMKIKANYTFYLALLGQEKTGTGETLTLLPKRNNVNFLLGQVKLASSGSNQLNLIAEKNKYSPTHYGIKIRALDFCDDPIFRFDADGQPHRNDLPDIPLPERQVTTPHFHKYNSDGIEVAYKTEVLKNDAQASAIQNDINFGLEHFSNEGKVRYEGGNCPSVVEQQSGLPLGSTSFDPLRGINF